MFKEIHPNGSYQGWYKVFGDEGSKVANDTVYTPNGNEETLYGKFGYVITFMNEGQVFQTLYTTAGAKGNQLANLGSNPTLGTYTFRGWTTGQNGTGNAVTTSYQFSGNTTVYAKWVSVITYNNNGAGSTVGNKEIIKGQQISSSNLPALTSAYTFKGWFSDNNTFKNQVQASYVPTGNTTIYAKWVSFVNVKYNGAGGTDKTVDVLKGKQLNTVVANPSSAYTFKGWCSSNPTSTSTATLASNWAPTGNTTIYAKWVSVITYNINGAGNTIANKEVLKGQQLTSTNLPNATGGSYTFRGWFADNNTFKTQIQTTYVPTGNQTIYCKWVSLVTFHLAEVSEPAINFGWRPQAPVEVVKGQSIQGIDPYPESNDSWKAWYDSYRTNGLDGYSWVGTGNRIMNWNGSFVPTGGTINLYPGT